MQRLSGLAVVDTDVTDAELIGLHDAGVRGVRVNFLFTQTRGMSTPAFLRQIVARIAPLGWHVQVLMLSSAEKQKARSRT